MPRDVKTSKTAFEKHPTTSSYLESFSKLYKFLRTDTFTDVKFSVRGINFTAHKLVLAAHSPVFLAMFDNPMLEAASGQVVVDDVKPRIFEFFLNYLYTGIEPKIGVDESVELFVCADKYSVNPLMITCEKILCKKMTARNVIEIFLMAEAYNRPVLRRRAFQCMGLYMADVVQTEGWNLIKDNTEQLKKIVCVMMKRRKQFQNLTFERPRGRRQDLLLGRDLVKIVVRVDRHTMSHLRPQELRFKVCSFEVLGYVIINEDRYDRNRIIATIRSVKRTDSQVDNYPFLFEVLVSSQENPNDVIDHRKVQISWTRLYHPTLGSPPCIIYKENDDNLLPKAGPLFFEIKVLEGKFEERQLPKLYLSDDKCSIGTPAVLNDFVHIAGENCIGWDVPMDWLCGRTRTFFTRNNLKEFHIADAPKETLETLIRCMYSYSKKSSNGLSLTVLPSRDTMDLSMLKAACQLRMDYDLIMFLEHVLVWDLDPWNCLNLIEAGTELGLGFLKHGALLYFKTHSDRIINRTPDTWNSVKPSVLKEILLDMNWGTFPGKISFLPDFLIAPRKPLKAIPLQYGQEYYSCILEETL